jgi:predicted permease
VLAVLAIAVVNIANLMLMRATERAADLAVRRALGASRGRLAALLISESLALAALGGLAGVGLAKLLLALYLRLGSDLPRLAEVAIDGRVLALATALVLLCGLALGAVPLLFGSAAAAPKQTRGAGAGRGQQLARNGLVALEFALALPLLLGAGLLIDSLVRLQRVDPGFDPNRLLTAQLKLLPTKHPDAAAQRAFWERALPELAAIPGVSGVGFAATVPPSCGCYNDFEVVGRPSIQGQTPMSPWIPATKGFLEALAVPLLEGRSFAPSDTPDSPPVILVSATWAKRYFPGESAVGKQIYEGGDKSQPVTVIGVVGDVRFDGLRNPGEAVFAPISQGWPSNPTYIYLRTQLSPLALAEPLRQTLRRLDPDLVPTEVTTLSSLLEDSLGGQRQWAVVITGFALAAVLLAAVGVFSVLAAYVARQQREIGIRLALGADRRRVVRGVVGRGFAWALGGTAVGVVLALFLTRGLESLLFAVGRFDALNLLGATALLLAVAFAACWLPARRAAAVDPMVALRYE